MELGGAQATHAGQGECLPTEREIVLRKVGATARARTLSLVPKRERLEVRATTDELRRWRRSASAAGAASLSAFVRDLLDERTKQDEAERTKLLGPDWTRTLEIIASGGRSTW